MRILGIDPGSRVAGYGVLQCDHRDRISCVIAGVISMPDRHSFEERLVLLGQNLRAVIAQYQPHIAVVEKIFFGRNADSAFKLGHARGVCLYETQAAGVKLVEYAAREVKKGITGSGAAGKEQVQTVIIKLLQMAPLDYFDASDALALAYHHACQMHVQNKLANIMKEL